MSSPHQPPPGGSGSPTGSESYSVHYPPTPTESEPQVVYSPSVYSQVSYTPGAYTPSNYSQGAPSTSSVQSGYGQYTADDYRAEVGQPYSSSTSSGRSSPGPGDSISVEWGAGETSEHRLGQNRVETWAQRAGRWVVENDERIVNFVSLVASPGVQGSAGLRGNAVANSVGLALAAGPGMYVVGKEVVNSLRNGRQGDMVRAAYGAVAAAGALTWGVGYAPGQDTTAGNAGAIVHGAGSAFMVTRGPREQPGRPRQDTEARGDVADTASSHRRGGATSRNHTSRTHTSRTSGRDSGSSHEPVSRRNGSDRTRDQHRRGGGGNSGGGGGVVR
ncbi:hypothetical protein [Micromonospora sp. RL09-050-HVF-A]|uniref:hypothetical protein n=1 Tax=unclassified Micromonospora TaxID=2617518 RepID=UPI001C5E5CDC|nr:hypothetical protein [Micromonospora sp. RL09-050-HVF-A]MBW4700847.1 hypothetical protein [Micromonospora sp. RL09-050-HVF-A]